MKDITCKTCQQKVHGRNNQIYCTQKCKNEYNNALYRKRHVNALTTLKVIMNNAKKMEKLYMRYGDVALNSKVFIASGVEPGYTNFTRTDGLFEFDDWALKEIGEDLYKIISPRTYKGDE